MRKATICFLMLLCSVLAFGQDEPQWKVVKHVIFTQQTQRIGGTLLIPTEPGLYRLNLYFSESGGGGPDSYYEAQLHATDVTGTSVDFAQLLYCSSAGAIWMPPIMVYLKPQKPLTYNVSVSPSPTASCQYNLAITVEQLVQQ